MSRQERGHPCREAVLTPEDLAGEHGAALPDREVLSLITGPGGAGPLPILGPPLGTFTPDTPGEMGDPESGRPLPVAQDVGPAK